MHMTDPPMTPAVALIFAGGAGTRMSDSQHLPKQFIEVAGVPILIHTLSRFEDSDVIDQIYLVVPNDWTEYAADLVERYRISKVACVLSGGDTALLSIFKGLSQMVTDQLPDQTIVVIHDGVRPIISSQLIEANVEMARREGNAITSIPAFETVAIKHVGNDTVETVIDRRRAFVLQAPQTFHLNQVYQTNLQAINDDTISNFVDQANMQAHYGERLFLLNGFRGNVKITIPDDVTYFTYLVETGQYERIIMSQDMDGRMP